MQVEPVNHSISKTWTMFHLRVFSTSIYKIWKSNLPLLVRGIFPNLDQTQGRSVNGTTYLGHVWNFAHYFYFNILACSASCPLLRFVVYTLWQLHSILIFRTCEKSSFLIKTYSKSYICIYPVEKIVELIAEAFS